MNIKLIKSVDILGSTFKIEYDKSVDGANFSCRDSYIKIGIRSIKKDPLYVLSIISHEVMEIILCMMGGRFENVRIDSNYLFSFNHQTFENAIQIHIQTIAKFIK